MKKIFGLFIVSSMLITSAFAQVPTLDQASKAANDAKTQAKQEVSKTKEANAASCREGEDRNLGRVSFVVCIR